jgi:hypothetical protein
MVVEFPNAAWNHAAGWVLLVGTPVAVVVTLVFFVLQVIRLVGRWTRKRTPPTIVPTRPPIIRKLLRSHPLLSGLIGAVLLAGFVFSLLSYIEKSFQSSAVYQTSIATAKASPEVLAILGSPIEIGWFTSGEISESNDGTGKAALKIPLSGPRGKGKLLVHAGRRFRSWRVSILQFVPTDRGSTIDLLNELSR